MIIFYFNYIIIAHCSPQFYLHMLHGGITGRQSALAMSPAGGFVIYLFGMGQCTSNISLLDDILHCKIDFKTYLKFCMTHKEAWCIMLTWIGVDYWLIFSKQDKLPKKSMISLTEMTTINWVYDSVEVNHSKSWVLA